MAVLRRRNDDNTGWETVKMVGSDVLGNYEIVRSEHPPAGLKPGTIWLDESEGGYIDPALANHEAENANKAHGGFKQCILTGAGYQNIPNNSNTTIAWSVAKEDGATFFNPSNPTRITVPNGVSKIVLKGNLLFPNHATGARQIHFRKNDSSTPVTGIGTVSVPAAPADRPTMLSLVSAVLDVVQGDFFEMQAFQTSGGALSVDVSLVGVCWFSLEVIE